MLLYKLGILSKNSVFTSFNCLYSRGLERGLAYDEERYANSYFTNYYYTFNNIQLRKTPYYNFCN